MISILCAMHNSNYYKIPGLDVWDKTRNAYNFNGDNPVICHPPCAQWSKLKSFAKKDKEEKDLANFCVEKVNRNGGILEHPAGSAIWRLPGLPRNNIISINQHWFGFKAQKRTWLYFKGCEALSYPISLDIPPNTVAMMSSATRSLQTLSFCKWLVDCVDASFKCL